jgi:hypothetical protein
LHGGTTDHDPSVYVLVCDPVAVIVTLLGPTANDGVDGIYDHGQA